jgi:hypothetical protein
MNIPMDLTSIIPPSVHQNGHGSHLERVEIVHAIFIATGVRLALSKTLLGRNSGILRKLQTDESDGIKHSVFSLEGILILHKTHGKR